MPSDANALLHRPSRPPRRYAGRRQKGDGAGGDRHRSQRLRKRDKPWEAERDGSGERLWSALDAEKLGLLDPAHLLLQVRRRVLKDDLAGVSRRWYRLHAHIRWTGAGGVTSHGLPRFPLGRGRPEYGGKRQWDEKPLLIDPASPAGRTDSRLPLALRRLAEQLGPSGIQVLDDGSHVQLGPERRFHNAVDPLVQPERLSRLTQEQTEVLAIVVMDGMATRRRIEEFRGAARLSIGPRGSSETLALLLSRGLLCPDRDDHATGRPLVYRPTPRLLQLIGAETLEEARRATAVTAEHRSEVEPTPGSSGPLNTELTCM